MRRLAIVVLIVLITPAIPSNARSVHSTEDVDLFPQGNMQNSSEWEFKKHLAFTPEDRTEDGEYAIGMLEDSHITMGIELPQHSDEETFWATTSPTNSNASLGSPDGAYTYSAGPDIILGGFNVEPYTSNQIMHVELTVHFEIPELLTQDKARFSTVNSGVYNLVKTWSNTQGGLYYMTNGWSINITGEDGWTWEELSNLEIDLDYVSNGGTDDSQLRVDAVGLRVIMQTPWYGAERVTASSQNEIEEWPIIEFNFSSGTLSSVSSAPCGLQASNGTWTSDVMVLPAAQSWGRLHTEQSNLNGSIGLEYLGDDGDWVSISEGLIPSVTSDLQVRITIVDTCLSRAWIDINDPHIQVKGSISGDYLSMTSYTRWTIVVNGITVANNDAASIGNFDIQASIGHTLNPNDTTLDVEIKAWYNWGNNGSAASMILQLTQIKFVGAYSIEYDEDPVCSMIGSHDLQEDGGGMLIPLISRCSDDRTPTELLVVNFENDNPDLIEVDLTQGQVRFRLLSEQHGTAQITTTVIDEAGNYWREISLITVESVNDLPVLKEFQSVVPVEHGYIHNVSFDLSDKDTFSGYLTVTTNKSWATVDMENRTINVNAPTPGFTSVSITACDEENCVERILYLEVRALAELSVEEIRIRDDIREGDVFEVEVFVRNSGQVSASNVGIRCYVDDTLFGSPSIVTLTPGELEKAVCDIQAPYDDDSVIIKVEVDRSMTVDEVDESNNIKIEVIPILENEAGNTKAGNDDSFSINQTSTYIATGVILLIILSLFGLLAPPKLKKLE